VQSFHETIVWNETLMTGVAIIDEQHHILVDMLNEANTRLTENSGRIVLEDIVHDLMSYAVYHFDTEEELMVENHFDPEELKIHVREHRAFSTKVSGLQQELKQGKLISREELLSFLNGWLINHILKTDMKLAGFLNKAKARSNPLFL
jgi:hemerythrin-like metal-binding protein